MSKLLRYFKPYIIAILVVVAFQSFRAYATVQIPSYTSDIIDVGVQTYGVEEVLPYVIGEEDFNKLRSSAVDSNNFYDYYTFVDITEDSENLKFAEKEYKINPTSDFYMLNKNITETEKEILNRIFIFPMGIYGLNSVPKELMQNSLSSIPNIDIEDPKTLEMVELIAKTGTMQILRNAGVDMESYQRAYVLNEGSKMIVLAFASLISILVAYFLASKITVGVVAKIREDLLEKVLKFSSSDINNFSTSTLITRVTNDLQQVNNFILIFLQIAILSPVLAMFGLMKSYQNSESMFYITLISVVVLMILIAIVIVLVVPKLKLNQKYMDNLNLVSREMINGVLVIRAFSNEKLMNKKFEDANKNYIDNNLKIAYSMSTIMPTMFMIFNISAVAIIWFGAINVSNGVLNAGDIVANIQYTSSVIFGFMMLSMLIFNLPRAQVSANRIIEVLEHKLIIEDEGKEVIENIEGVVEFKDVDFKYDISSQESALEKVSFTAKPNEITAIIGSTGSGKSTIINLLPRLLDVTGGQILIDGKNIKDITKESLHDKIALVPQKTNLFSGTIESNIKFSNKDLSDELMINASEVAEAIEFIDSKEEKYKAPISQGGGNVSGGQKQRLSIARAIASGRKIFLFDDSFSALDYKTDAKLRNKLKEKLKDITMIIVAQRISTIRYADQIIVLDEGKVVGKGKHNELLDSCEVYKEMALSQLPKEGLYNE